MDELSDVAIVEALRRQLTVAATQQAVAAGNLANVNTPGYRAREVRFDDILDRGLAQTTQAAATHPAHIRPAEPTVAVREAGHLEARRDGNNVELDKEMLNMIEATGKFGKAQAILAAKFRLVRYAIREGR